MERRVLRRLPANLFAGVLKSKSRADRVTKGVTDDALCDLAFRFGTAARGRPPIRLVVLDETSELRNARSVGPPDIVSETCGEFRGGGSQ